jgi:hypothetical protein
VLFLAIAVVGNLPGAVLYLKGSDDHDSSQAR